MAWELRGVLARWGVEVSIVDHDPPGAMLGGSDQSIPQPYGFGPHLRSVVVRVPTKRNPLGEETTVAMGFGFPPELEGAELNDFVLRSIKLALEHEVDEAFTVGGVPWVDPHDGRPWRERLSS